MLRDEEIAAISWDDIGQEDLVRLCRNWHDEPELFRRILVRALELVYLDHEEFADEVGVASDDVRRWIRGKDLPQVGWMLLILTDVIQVRLQTIRRRKPAEA